ncbi:winged helix DNA-binding domain-containing protein [Labedaea rhizosphaerae]|nr:winged helix DNA-binding domain-containing protein [Labedaea rhizosphaerae]
MAPITRRGLNRALLHRQGLLTPWTCSPATAIDRLIGLQAQSPSAPYFGLWSRLESFEPAQLARLLETRKAVRATMMRGTLHLFTAADYLRVRPVLQPMLTGFVRGLRYGKDIERLDQDKLLDAGRRLLTEQPLSAADLGAALASYFPGTASDSLAMAVRMMVPAVQPTPRGVWGRGGKATFTTAAAWLGTDPGAAGSPDELVRRYLKAFGPATVADVQNWSGLRGLREVVDRMRPSLRSLRDEDGRELVDVPRGPLPDPDTPAPVRLIAEYDNLTLSHADRSRVIADEHRAATATANGVIPGMVLVDGMVAGTWKLTKTTVTLRELSPWTPAQRAEVEALAHRALEFAAPGEHHHVVG